MPLDSEFFELVAPLDRNWTMGVELMSPLIYSLIRCTRPRSVLEVGAGYSSVFILQALADNVSEYERHKELMREQVRSDQQDNLQWIKNKITRGRHPLPLSLPEYYEVDYRPTLSIIDNMSHSAGSAGLVQEIADRLGLTKLLRFHGGDFRGMSKSFPENLLPLDFVWFDCGAHPEYSAFLGEYWTLINPDGGLLLLHSTLTNLQIRSIIQGLKLKQATDHFNKFEMLSLLEPHKWRQNSVTMIRMLPGAGEKLYTIEP